MSNQPGSQSNTVAAAALTFLFLAIVAGMALSSLVPPAVTPATAPQEEFSAARAFEHLKAIARDPHPTGSAANARVRDYLIQQLEQQGLDPQVQRTSIASLVDIFSGPYAAGTIENIAARLKGTASTGVVLLMAHYDSVGAAPGATDDGSGVVTLLEIIRALKSSPPLRNDVIFLFTDGEELGEVGSQGFVSEHPWAKEISAVWNLDSGGSCGAADIDFVNAWAFRSLQKAIRHPLASSIGGELKKLAPLGGDDTLVFDPAKMAIAQASYSGCPYRYHTVRDNLDNIALRSVQHLGLYTLAVVREWGNSNLREIPPLSENIYFVFAGRIISYPVSIARPASLVLIVVYALLVLFAFKRSRLTVRSLGLGILLWLILGFLCAGLTASIWWILKARHLVNFSYSSAYNAETYAVAFVVVSVALGSGLYLLFRRAANGDSLAIGGLFWCLILTAFSSWFAPGTSFLFSWPLGFGLLSLAISFRNHPSNLIWILRLLCAVPAVSLFTLLIGYTILHLAGDPGPSLVVAVVLSVICLAFLAPQFDAITAVGGLRASPIIALVGVGFLAFAIFRSGYDSQHPRPDTIAYWLNGDTGNASWISLDESPDSWTSQFLAGGIVSDTVGIFVNPGGDKVLKSDAPLLPLTPPQVVLLSDSSTASARTLHLRLTSARHSATLWLSVEGATVLEAAIDGKKVPSKMVEPHDKLWGFYYAAPPLQGIELTISFNPFDKPRIILTDQTSGLPEIPGFRTVPRTQEFMPLNYFPAFDSTTLVSKTFTAPQPN